MKKEKEYIATYRSGSGYMVLGWVKAKSIIEAKRKIKKEFLEKAKERFISGVQIGEWKGNGPIFF